MSEIDVWDIDGTLRPDSLLADAIRYGVEKGFVDPSRFVDTTHPTLEEIRYFVEAITERSHHDFRELTNRISDEASEQAYPWAIERLSKRREEGGEALILSHSPDFLVRAFARGLGVRRAAGSYYHTKGLVFSGHAVTRDKPATLKRHMRQRGIQRVAFAAGDSIHDVPILEQANTAVVVNPAPHLAELALQYGWEIINTE